MTPSDETHTQGRRYRKVRYCEYLVFVGVEAGRDVVAGRDLGLGCGGTMLRTCRLTGTFDFVALRCLAP